MKTILIAPLLALSLTAAPLRAADMAQGLAGHYKLEAFLTTRLDQDNPVDNG